jgi:hypothetical protein
MKGFENLTPRQKRDLSLQSIYLILMTAERVGSDEDKPEGSRTITITDTLALQMISTIEAYVEHGVDYLLTSDLTTSGN